MSRSSTSKPFSNRLLLLFGAGASVEAGIPHVVAFVKAFEHWLQQNYGRNHSVTMCYKAIKLSWNQSVGTNTVLHLERLYELLHFINLPSGTDSIPRILPSTFPRKSRTTELLFWNLTQFVYARCINVDAASLRYLYPLATIAQRFPHLTILTLNYDACVERVLDAHHLSWTDGFSDVAPTFSEHILPKFTSSRAGVRPVPLIKLHGSVTWHQMGEGIVRVLASSEERLTRTFKRAQSMVNHSTMIFPVMNKGLAHGPFPSLFSEAQQALATADLCVAIGYGFNDQHLRQMVVEGLKVNKKLKVALVNPAPHGPLRLLYEEAADPNLQKRIGFLPHSPIRTTKVPACGFLEGLLSRNRLLNAIRNMVSGRGTLCSPTRFDRDILQTSVGIGRRKVSGKRWVLMHPFPGGSGRMHLLKMQLRVISGDKIFEVDLQTGKCELLFDDFVAPEAIAYDSDARVLYAIEPKYRGIGKEWIPPLLKDRYGLGRLWKKEEGLAATPISRLRVSRVQLSRMERQSATPMNYIVDWKSRLKGILRFATEILIERGGRSLLIAQAGSGLWRYVLSTGKYSLVVRVPNCVNLIGVHRYSKKMALLVDGGVHPNGYGRLMRCNLTSGRISVLAGGWSRIGGVALDKAHGIILISLWHPWPAGRVFALDARHPEKPPLFEWRGLNLPRSIVVTRRGILVSTGDGVCELKLR